LAASSKKRFATRNESGIQVMPSRPLFGAEVGRSVVRFHSFVAVSDVAVPEKS
jgi:hypothetical protein